MTPSVCYWGAVWSGETPPWRQDGSTSFIENISYPDAPRRVRLTSLTPDRPTVAPLVYDLDAPINHRAAFALRMGRVLPTYSRLWRSEFASYVRLHRKVYPVADWHGDDWIMASRSYSLRRKKELLAVVQAGLHLYYDDFTVPQRVSAFIKNEPMPSFAKAPRFIYARWDPFKCAFAPYVKALEHWVYRDKHFVKGWTKMEIQEQMLRRIEHLPYKVVIDHTGYEATVTSWFIVNIVAPYYLDAGVPASMIATLAGINHIHSRKARMRVEGGTMSGEMDTSLRNGLVNHSAVRFIRQVMRRRSPNLEMDWLVEGDDLLIGCTEPIAYHIFEKLGFAIKPQEIETTGLSGFCGWYFNPDTRHALKPPLKVLNLMYAYENLSNWPSEKRRERYAAKLMSASHEYPHSPLVWVMVDQFEHSGMARFKVDWITVERYGHLGVSASTPCIEYKPAPVGRPTAGDREMYARLFEMQPDEQSRIEWEGVWRSSYFREWMCVYHPDCVLFAETHRAWPRIRR